MLPKIGYAIFIESLGCAGEINLYSTQYVLQHLHLYASQRAPHEFQKLSWVILQCFKILSIKPTKIIFNFSRFVNVSYNLKYEKHPHHPQPCFWQPQAR